MRLIVSTTSVLYRDPLVIGAWGGYVTMGAAYCHGVGKIGGNPQFQGQIVVPAPSWQCGQGTPSTSMIWNDMQIGGPPISGTPPHTPTPEGVPLCCISTIKIAIRLLPCLVLLSTHSCKRTRRAATPHRVDFAVSLQDPQQLHH